MLVLILNISLLVSLRHIEENIEYNVTNTIARNVGIKPDFCIIKGRQILNYKNIYIAGPYMEIILLMLFRKIREFVEIFLLAKELLVK